MASSWNRANNHNESYRGHFWNQSNMSHRFQHDLRFFVDVCGRSTTKVKRVWLGLVSEVETNLTKHFSAKRLLNFFSKTFIKSCPKASSARKEGWEGTSSGPAVTRTTRSWWAARARGSPTFVSPYFIVTKSCAIFMICKSFLIYHPHGMTRCLIGDFFLVAKVLLFVSLPVKFDLCVSRTLVVAIASLNLAPVTASLPPNSVQKWCQQCFKLMCSLFPEHDDRDGGGPRRSKNLVWRRDDQVILP